MLLFNFLTGDLLKGLDWKAVNSNRWKGYEYMSCRAPFDQERPGNVFKIIFYRLPPLMKGEASGFAKVTRAVGQLIEEPPSF
jgi:hypothetical protein